MFNQTYNDRILAVRFQPRRGATQAAAEADAAPDPVDPFAPFDPLKPSGTATGDPAKPEAGVDITGDSLATEFDLTPDYYIYSTWIRWMKARVQQSNVLNSDVSGTWEAYKPLLDRIEQFTGYRLEAGDQILLESGNSWYILGDADGDSGIFNDASHTLFNLLGSRRS